MKGPDVSNGEVPAAGDRRVSLTGYTNVVLDVSKPDATEEDRDRLR